MKRTYKDSIFRKLFNNEEELLNLYSAVSGIHYPKGTKIEIVTLEDCIFGDLKNDVAFLLEDRLIILMEHQATINPNMPLRMLEYLAKEYEKLYHTRAIYSRALVKIPTPELYVFYNGAEEAPLVQELKLSDAFLTNCDTMSLEMVVNVINVNYEKGAELLRQCRTLREYSMLIYLIREKTRGGTELETAIKESIKECVKQNILTDFLKRNGGEIMSFLFEELSREECEAIREQDGYERGKAEGEQIGIARGRQDGIAKGRSDSIKEILCNMKQNGFTSEQILCATGISAEELELLEQEIK